MRTTAAHGSEFFFAAAVVATAAAVLLLACMPVQARAAVRITGSGDEAAQSAAQSQDAPDGADAAEATAATDTAPVSTAVALPDLEGLEPLGPERIADGIYAIDVASSSSMFRIVDAQLTVSGDSMTCALTLSGTGYEKLFMGTGEQAEAADEDAFIFFEENDEGMYVYTVPVVALDEPCDCAAFSIRRQRWYDRTLVFLSARLPEGAVLAKVKEGAGLPGDAGDSGASFEFACTPGAMCMRPPVGTDVSRPKD